MSSVDRSPRPTLDARARFLLAFLSLASLGLLAYCFPYREHGINEAPFEGFLAGYARLAHAPISLLDPSAQLTGNEIHGRYAIAIVKGCDAIEAKILFVSAVLAFPSPWLQRLAAAVLGTLALAIVNVLRITSLYYVGMSYPQLVEVLHLEVWPLLIIALSAALFLAFVARSNQLATSKG